jgi:hypothetical protein
MKTHPFDEVAYEADLHVQKGRTVFQQFNCAHCGMKQTIDTPNHFFTYGDCEECGGRTDLKKAGCNYMMVTHLTSRK